MGTGNYYAHTYFSDEETKWVTCLKITQLVKLVKQGFKPRHSNSKYRILNDCTILPLSKGCVCLCVSTLHMLCTLRSSPIPTNSGEEGSKAFHRGKMLWNTWAVNCKSTSFCSKYNVIICIKTRKAKAKYSPLTYKRWLIGKHILQLKRQSHCMGRAILSIMDMYIDMHYHCETKIN